MKRLNAIITPSVSIDGQSKVSNPVVPVTYPVELGTKYSGDFLLTQAFFRNYEQNNVLPIDDYVVVFHLLGTDTNIAYARYKYEVRVSKDDVIQSVCWGTFTVKDSLFVD